MEVDQVVLRGAWQDQPAIGSGDIPVATYSSFDKTLNVGGGRLLPLRMVSDVTVSPAYRRRGLLRTLITQDLQDAVEQGAAGRRAHRLRGFDLRSLRLRRGHPLPQPRGRHQLALRAAPPRRRRQHRAGRALEAWPAVQDIFGRFHQSIRGSVERPKFYEHFLTGAFDYRDGPDKKLRAAVHLDAGGQPDGYAIYKPGERKETGRADRGDRPGGADAGGLPPDLAVPRRHRPLHQRRRGRARRWTDSLEWSLVEPRVVKVTTVKDQLWVRVLDVVAALEARPWGADGEVVIEVADLARPRRPGGSASPPRAARRRSAAPTTSRACCSTADTLGSLYLGDVASTPSGRRPHHRRRPGDPRVGGDGRRRARRRTASPASEAQRSGRHDLRLGGRAVGIPAGVLARHRWRRDAVGVAARYESGSGSGGVVVIDTGTPLPVQCAGSSLRIALGWNVGRRSRSSRFGPHELEARRRHQDPRHHLVLAQHGLVHPAYAASSVPAHSTWARREVERVAADLVPRAEERDRADRGRRRRRRRSGSARTG